MTSIVELIKMLYAESFFSSWKSLGEVKMELEGRGFNFSIQSIHMSLNNTVKKRILSKRKRSGKAEYSQRLPPETKIKEKEISELNKVLSQITEKKLGARFQQDIRELNTAFTHDCGNSAAFILRKILEKEIYYVFAENNKLDLLKDNSGKFIGLNATISLCSRETINGANIILPKTAKQLLGMKFLGDSAAHNYLMNVEVEDINPQLSYWTTAIKELTANLK